jgi:hypothetical protein
MSFLQDCFHSWHGPVIMMVAKQQEVYALLDSENNLLEV